MARNGNRILELESKLQPILTPNRRIRIITEIGCFVFCFLVAMTQLGIWDYYFIHYTGDNIWYCWIAGDVLVAALMLWLLIRAIKYNDHCAKKECKSDANLKYAYIVWFFYSMLVCAKLSTTIYTYASKVDRNEFFGPAVYRLVLSVSAFVFLLLVLSHHYISLNSPRQAYISYLASSITLDILDSVIFLELLYTEKLKSVIQNGSPLQISILVFVCVNFILPTFALLKLRYKLGLPKWICLPYEKMYTLIYFLIVNLPYLVLRFYVWRKAPTDYVDPGAGADGVTSIFMVKNIIMLFVGARELWVSFLLNKEIKNSTLTRSAPDRLEVQSVKDDCCCETKKRQGNGEASPTTSAKLYPAVNGAHHDEHQF